MQFNKVTSEHILKAIDRFKEKGFPEGFGPSSTYDIIHEGKVYPPKAIMAYASNLATGEEIMNDFPGGENTECFKTFENNGFIIISKSKVTDLIKEFINQANTEDLKTKHYKKIIDGLKVKVSFGAGNKALIPWIAFLRKPNRVSDGIYPVILFFREHNKLVLAYGVSATNSPEHKWNVDAKSINSWFADNLNIQPKKYGNSLVKSVYDLQSIDYNKLEKDFDEISKFYKSMTFSDYVKETQAEYSLFNNMNYWVFQGNPKIYDVKKALSNNAIKTWNVKTHKDKIKIGDKIIIWVTGKESGCYALAKVTSDVFYGLEEKGEFNYYSQDIKKHYKDHNNEKKANRVKIEVTHNFSDNPIYKDDILGLAEFSDFNGGNQGTNFVASEKQYHSLLSFYDKNSKEIEFIKRIKNSDFKSLQVYFHILDKLKIDLSLKNTENLVFSTSSNQLSFHIGKRYCLNLKKDKFYFIAPLNYDIKNLEKGSFNSPDNAFWYKNISVDNIHQHYSAILEGVKNELERDNHSESKDYDNKFFRESIFDLEIRQKYFDLIKSNSQAINTMSQPINQILYGPPGTGKTYFLKNNLFKKYVTKETSITKDQHLENVISNCSWWQVVALVLLDKGKSKVSDIYDHEWINIKIGMSNSKSVRQTIWGQLQSHTINECEFVKVSSRQQPLIFNKTEESYWEVLEEEVKDLVPEILEIKASLEHFNPNPDKLIKRHDFVTFHQSFSYEDFIEGIKPVFPENEEESSDLGYAVEDGVFKRLCLRAKNDPDNRYAIFIDEINRGNVSAIFGELITLIETDKRQGKVNEMSVKLPYSKEEFSVPSNLDIYGTMNTADRSVEALDTALRRRFEFEEMMPNYHVIADFSIQGFSLSKVLKTINQRIELLIDRDHTIGHSYFYNVKTLDELVMAFNNKIVPLLQEYFYGDYGKIGLVLGKGFVETIKNDKITFADFSYENSEDFKMPSYNLKTINPENIIEALDQLLNNPVEEN